MKINFKSLIAAAAVTLSGFFGAQAAALQFSTEAAPVWYQIRFDRGNAAIADQGANSNLKTVVSAPTEDAQQWQFIGDKDNFVLKSKLGNYVTYNSKFQSGKPGVALYIVKAGDKYEIGRVGSDSHFNQWGGYGAGKEIGEYNAGDVNNPLNIYDLQGNAVTVKVPTPVGELPKFSTDSETTWYFMQFKKGG